jgi:hypothetical protein
VIEQDHNSNWRSALEGNPSPVGAVTVTVETDCFLDLEFVNPPMKLRAVLIDNGRMILAIQADPNVLAGGTFTAR